MLIIGLVAVVFAPLFIVLGHEGSEELISLGDVVFSFCIAGLSAVVFESVFGKHYRVRHHARLTFLRRTDHWFARLLLTMLIWAWLAILLMLVVQTSALQSVIAAGLVITSYVIANRRDLFWNALWSGVLMAIVFFVVYLLSFFAAYQPQGQVFIESTPTDAWTWAITLGLVLGPMYEFTRDLKIRKPR